jgi:hypothetical protein
MQSDRTELLMAAANELLYDPRDAQLNASNAIRQAENFARYRPADKLWKTS